MSNGSQSSNVVAARYVGALIELAEESKKVSDIEKDFSDLAKMIESSIDLQHLIRSPLLNQSQQQASIDAIAKKARFTTLTSNFLKTLVDNRRLNILEAAMDVFAQEISKRRGEIVVSVETAQALTAAQEKSLQSALKKETGSNVVLDTKVTPEILGGIVVTIGSQRIDDSVARKLERLKATMSSGAAGANQNTNLKEVS